MAADATATSGDASTSKPAAQDANQPDETAASGDNVNAEAGLTGRSVEELQVLISEKNETIAGMKVQVDDLTDKLKRSLADMENLRFRTARDVENAQKYAVQGFVKSLLDVADNLQRASESVPGEKLEAPELDKEGAVKLLRGVLEGVQMTEKVLQQVFKQNGVAMFDPVGEKFNPNDHNALFEVPDPSKEAGTIAIVTKRGYKMHERVVRPADVGVVRAP